MLTAAQRAARAVSCVFEIVFLLLSILHDAIPFVEKSRGFLLSNTEKAVLRRHLQRRNSEGEAPIARHVPEQLLAAADKRVLLVDYENSSQGIAKVLLDRRAELSPDVLCCFVSQQRPDFMPLPVVDNCIWVGCERGVKEAADHVIASIVADMVSVKSTVYIIHGGDHRWFEVSKKYGVDHHVVQGGKKKATEEYVVVKNKWKI
jgi:hypothetical protein